MILQSLVGFYEQFAAEHPDKIARIGWCTQKVKFMLEISSEGDLINIIPAEEKRGWNLTVPEQQKRSVNISANFLCDNSSYILGIDAKENHKRATQCFEAAKEIHLALLRGVDSPASHAVCAFFEKWNPDAAVRKQVVLSAGEELLKSGNIVFRFRGKCVLEDAAIRNAWDREYRKPKEGAANMICLVSGKRSPVARIHPAIKGVAGAQPMGASLVGFNARAFESYGHDEEQGLNAPVSEYATFAYTTALNYLLADKKHHVRLGDTTVVYWCEKNDEACVDVVAACLGLPVSGKSAGKASAAANDQIIDSVMKKIVRGDPIANVDLDVNFYVLGLAPNAARLSVRFFQHYTFGNVLNNLRNHYERLDIVRPQYEKLKYLSPYWLLKETENPNAKQNAATSVLGGSLMRSILGNLPYPVALFEQTILRIRATQDNNDKHIQKITRGRVAIIKAYLIKNCKQSKEVITVSLNEDRTDAPYVLGRLFSVLEAIQEAASPGLNSTIKNKYYDSASATPSVVFPVVINLSEKHSSKLSRDNKGLAVHYEKMKVELLNKLDEFPKRFSLEEQGAFILGYYHQTQKRYEKKDSNTESAEA